MNIGCPSGTGKSRVTLTVVVTVGDDEVSVRPSGSPIFAIGTEPAAKSLTCQPSSPRVSNTYCLKYSASFCCWTAEALVVYVNMMAGRPLCNCCTACARALDSDRDTPALPPVPPMPG